MAEPYFRLNALSVQDECAVRDMKSGKCVCDHTGGGVAAALFQPVLHVLLQSLLLMMMITLFGDTEEKGGAD